jgi:hypothetical protein
LALGCEVIAGIENIAWSPELAEAGAPTDEMGHGSGDDAGSDAITSPDGTMPLDDSGDEGPIGTPEVSTPEGASSSPDADDSSDAGPSTDGSTEATMPPDALPSEAGGVVCGEGVPLARTEWATNPGTTASDGQCGSSSVVNLFDGLLTTRWSTSRLQTISPAEWLELDLGCPQTFSEIVLDATDDNVDYPRGYTVQVSTDNSTWTQVASGAGSTAITSVTFASTAARYIRINQTGTASSNFWSIDELNICGTTSGICGSPTQYSRAGWATNPGTTASDNVSSLAAALDGSASTRWDSNRLQVASPPEWVQIDMGVSQPVSQVILQDFNNCNDYPQGYTLQVSVDFANWTQVASGAGSSPFTNITFPSAMARYLKITQTGASTTYYWSIDELNVYH